jgi:hypothetical protein
VRSCWLSYISTGIRQIGLPQKLALREKANLARKVKLFVSDTKSQIRDWIVGYPAFAEKTRVCILLRHTAGKAVRRRGPRPTGSLPRS